MKLKKHFAKSNESLDIYFHEISKIDLLDADEEVELAIRIRQGDKSALDHLVKANLRFVVSVAKQFQGQGLSLEDLINEGNIGLLKAVQRFDETRGFKFISYAIWWIRQSILEALSSQSRIVRLPMNKIGELGKIKSTYAELEQKLGRVPTILELSTVLKMSVEDVAHVLGSSRYEVSFDSPISDGESETTLLDVTKNEVQESPDHELMSESLKLEIKKILKSLPKREAEVITLYFGIGQENPLTLEEIGDRYNLTRERIRQIKEKAIRSLRYTAVESLKDYLN